MVADGELVYVPGTEFLYSNSVARRTTAASNKYGQVLTSVEDLVRWDRNFYRPAVGGEPLLERLHREGVLADGSSIDYALGLAVDDYRGLRRVQHGGAWGGFRAMLMRFPAQRTSVICLCNRVGGRSCRLAGRLLNEELEVGWRIEILDSVLSLQIPNREPITLEPAGDGKLAGGRMRLSPRRDAAGAVTAIEVDAGRVTGIRFLRR
ncbi:MAG: serine hydrolase [Acidobacteriota bacterium]|nr:serine hydrolase [Acidobacteriota bacterium]